MRRLAQGGLVDRGRPLAFTFDGRPMTGLAGDTLSSALLTNGIRLIGRSFKYHRPRGIMTAGEEEPNALVTLGRGAAAVPNARATTVPLFDGLEASSQNCWPNPNFDLMSINRLFAPIFVAGFYYKTFMWPAGFWEKVYEPLIRRAAGLGSLSPSPDPESYDRAHAFCDLLVVGAGPAGLASALSAGRAGVRVVLVDQDERLGGRLLAERLTIADAPASLWVEAAGSELASLPNVTILARTTVFGAYDGEVFGAVERVRDPLPPLAGVPRQRLWKIVAKRTLLATGAIERPLVFGGNDRPGVMMASAVQAYVNRHAVDPGRVALFVTSDSGWRVAAELVEAGVDVVGIVDPRPDPGVTAPPGIPVFAGSMIIGTHGKTLSAVDVRDANGRIRRLSCDVLAMAGGWNPAMGLGCNLGAKPVFSDAIQSFVLDTPPDGMALAGAAAGRFSLRDALEGGAQAAAKAAEHLGKTSAPFVMPQIGDERATISPFWHVAGSRQKAFVDFQHDVTDADIALAAREGFTSVEHLKRYTTLGMATDQGKTSQINGHALLAIHTGKSMAEAATVLSRPPYLPVAIGAFAGMHRDAHFRPVRHTAAHDWAAEMGATFVDTGQWKRAQWFARPDETDWLESVSREVRAVRDGVGICDVSTLGKIELLGPDAGILLDRLYTNMFSTLPVGRARYGVMLREDGIVMDDGTTTRLGQDRYFLTTTTANAARVMQHIDYARQVLWPALDVHATSVTEQWTQFAVAGPRSRALLQRLLPERDLSNEAFPYMAAEAFSWAGVPTRLFRLSFSGELAYEIAVPASYGDALARALMAVGASEGVTPYGTEALGVMRIEKGHPAGNELDGRTTAADLGLGKMMSARKDYIGRVMASREGLTGPGRLALIGVRPVEPGARLRAGAHLLPHDVADTADHDLGHLTSVAFSPTLGHWIGLALLADARTRIGQRLRAHDPVRAADVAVEICAPVFVDPEGARLRG